MMGSRQLNHPLETGGILVGHYNQMLDSAVIVAATRAPLDSTRTAGSLAWMPPFVERALEAEIKVELPCPAILGGRNHEFLTWYSKTALEIFHHPENVRVLHSLPGIHAADVCIILEQWLLSICAMEAGVTINYLTDEVTNHLNSVDSRWIPKLGFTHLSGDSKRDRNWMKTVARLNKASPEYMFPTVSTIQKSRDNSESINFDAIPCKFLVSMEDQSVRRENTVNLLGRIGVKAAWKVPVKIPDIPWNKTPGIYKRRPKYASQLWTLMALFDEVEESGAKTLVHFEDDIVLHPEICELLPEIRVPSDWKFIYLGGRNGGYREHVNSGLVKSSFVSDLHAVIIKSEIIPDLRAVLLNSSIHSVWADFRFATLHWQHAAYICRPNLIWQSFHQNDSGVGQGYSNYYEDGNVMYGQGD